MSAQAIVLQMDAAISAFRARRSKVVRERVDSAQPLPEDANDPTGVLRYLGLEVRLIDRHKNCQSTLIGGVTRPTCMLADAPLRLTPITKTAVPRDPNDKYSNTGRDARPRSRSGKTFDEKFAGFSGGRDRCLGRRRPNFTSPV